MTELFLTAVIGGRRVACASAGVEAVVDLGPIVPVPGMADHVRGLSALRSRVVTVIDPAAMLGTGACAGSRAVVVALDGHDYALLVDHVDDVAAHEPLPLPAGLALTGAWRAVALGLVMVDGATALVIDPHALLRRAGEARAA